MSASPLQQIGDYFDVLTEELDSARAIVDCAMVIVAQKQTGQGFAGHVICDESLPAALEHARALMSSAHNQADLMQQTAVEALKKLTGGVA